VLGVFSGLWSLFVFPLIGAMAGEFCARDALCACAEQVGFANWAGILWAPLSRW